jgi:hypothetical protein
MERRIFAHLSCILLRGIANVLGSLGIFFFFGSCMGAHLAAETLGYGNDHHPGLCRTRLSEDSAGPGEAQLTDHLGRITSRSRKLYWNKTLKRRVLLAGRWASWNAGFSLTYPASYCVGLPTFWDR